jgi:hypothetical protein
MPQRIRAAAYLDVAAFAAAGSHLAQHGLAVLADHVDGREFHAAQERLRGHEEPCFTRACAGA